MRSSRTFLESQFIATTRSRRSGPGRLATLLSYGIETAATYPRAG